MGTFVAAMNEDNSYNADESIMENLFKQYERVIVESIITSFGLDAFIQDRHGGDVDTILNVRKIGNDPNMQYKNRQNQVEYEGRGEYSATTYHQNTQYIQKNREISQQKKAGMLFDEYTGKPIKMNESYDLDHTISANEIHNDPGRVLSGLSGIDLANSPENLHATNPHTNRTKKALTMDEFQERYGDEYSESEKNQMKELDAEARASYEAKIARAYYTSPKFIRDTAAAAAQKGAAMGLRQVWGFIFTEVWFAAKEEFDAIREPYDFGDTLVAVGNGVKRGFENAKVRYKDLIARFSEGAISGVLSSLTTTICNIFFTTAKKTVKIIRQTYASLVQAVKVLLLNPDCLPLGERLRATSKIIATGASIVVGGLVNEAIDETAVGKIPVVGEVISIFCGSLVTGIMTCTLLYFLDRSELVNRMVSVLNSIPTMSDDVNYFVRQAEFFERYAAELMEIDFECFKKETAAYQELADNLENAVSEEELHNALTIAYSKLGIQLSWKGEFDTFMSDKNNRLVFE